MEKFLVRKKIAKNIFQAKLYLVLFSVICLSVSAHLFVETIEEQPELFIYAQTQE
jgi:hypothetical protein